jgi:hypothetical protein
VNLFKIKFNENEKNELKAIIEKKNPCDLEVNESFNSIWYQDPKSETELRILFLENFRLTVSRVAFKNKRIGTMTDVYEFLKTFCMRNRIKKLVIQSVETEEMAAFCIKNNLIPNQFCIDAGNYLMGDYEMEL